MSQLLRVQCFGVTRDGFGAGVGQSLDHPFGHSANPADLFSWAGAHASWVNRTDPGGSRGLDDYFTCDFTYKPTSLTVVNSADAERAHPGIVRVRPLGVLPVVGRGV